MDAFISTESFRLFTRRAVPGVSAFLLTLGTLLGAGPVQAADDLQDTPANIRDEMITVGARGGKERSAIDSAVPVDSFDLETLAAGGQTELSRMLQMASPSFNFSTSTVSDGTDVVRPATLRGMQPDQTLVLINGKRRHNSALMHVNGSIGRGTAGVDLNAIPASSIQRIEVLRDGAAAQYGSDAIAGVINVILKDQTGSIDPFIQYGQTFDGDGEQVLGSINAGVPLGEGFLNATLEYRDRGATNRAGDDLRQQFNFQEQVLGQPQLADSDGDGICDTGGPCTVRADEPNVPGQTPTGVNNHRYGDPDSENIYFSWNAMLPLGPTELYSFGGIAQREGESGGFFRRNYDGRSVPAIHADGFLPLINTNVDDTSAGIGLRWNELLTFDWDASLVYGENEFEFIINNSNNVALGSLSPTSANAGKLGTELLVFNLDTTREFDWFAGTQLSFGFEYRDDTYTLTPGETNSFIGTSTGPACDDAGQPACFDNQYGGTPAAGIQVFPGFQPANQRNDSRDSVALYADLEMDLTDRFLIGIAARYEDYSDFGNTLNGKLSARWRVIDSLALRASGSTGFRAPSLQQQFFNNISTQFVTVGGVPNVPTEVGTFANDSDVVRQGFGIPQLQEETSVNLSGGFAWTPTESFTATVDFYYITVEDRVVLSGQFKPEADDGMGGACVPGAAPGQAGYCPIADILAPFGVNSAQFFSNAIDTETTGVDIVLDYGMELGSSGFLTLTAGMNFNKVEKDGATKVPDTLVDSPEAAETLYSRQETIWLEDGQPDQHHIFSALYDRGPLSLLAKANYFGEVKSTEDSSDPSLDQTFGAKWLIDLEAGWAFTDSIKLVVGANNIFDETPDENIAANSFNGIFPYNRRTTPFGFNGGFYYARLAMSFGTGL
jgi:iron complex outermembrane receptor protein